MQRDRLQQFVLRYQLKGQQGVGRPKDIREQLLRAIYRDSPNELSLQSL